MSKFEGILVVTVGGALLACAVELGLTPWLRPFFYLAAAAVLVGGVWLTVR